MRKGEYFLGNLPKKKAAKKESVYFNKSNFIGRGRDRHNNYQKGNSTLLSQNPLDSDGKVTKCRICESKFH